MRSTLSLVLCVVLAALIGCQNNDSTKSAQPKPKPDWEWDGMAPSETARSIADIAYAQAAAGARAESTLLPMHFNDAGQLNALGLYRLDMIFSQPDNLPPALYLNWASDDAQMTARRESIEQWLQNAGIDADAVAMKDGPNPVVSTPAEPNLARMWKTERPGGAISGSGENDTSGISPQVGAPGGMSSP